MLSMPTKKMKTDGASVTLHTQVSGKVAEWLVEMKEDGYVTSYTDAVLQGLVLLHTKFSSLTRREPSPITGDELST
jgi:hypothetical protein